MKLPTKTSKGQQESIVSSNMIMALLLVTEACCFLKSAFGANNEEVQSSVKMYGLL